MKKETLVFFYNKFLKCFISCIVYLSLFFIIYIIYKTYGDTTFSIKDKYTIYISSLMGIGILIAYRQIVSNNDLARRQLSITESLRILKEIREKRKELESFENIDYAKEVQLKQEIRYQTIHKWICKLDKNENPIGEPGSYELTEYGKRIRTLIRSTINDYEYLAIGIVNGAFDEKIIKDGMSAMLVNTYKIFANYIEHVRQSENEPTFARNFEWLANEWKDRKNNVVIRDK